MLEVLKLFDFLPYRAGGMWRISLWRTPSGASFRCEHLMVDEKCSVFRCILQRVPFRMCVIISHRERKKKRGRGIERPFGYMTSIILYEYMRQGMDGGRCMVLRNKTIVMTTYAICFMALVLIPWDQWRRFMAVQWCQPGGRCFSWWKEMGHYIFEHLFYES